MKLFSAFIKSRYPWAILAGLLLAASFPKISIAGLAWIAPGCILLTAFGQTGRQAFRIGYVAGLAHYLASLYWLLLIPVAWFPILGWLALSAFLALYPAVWVWLCWKFFPVKLSAEGSGSTLQYLIEQFLSTSWRQRLFWTLSGAALWVTLEMIVSRFLSGFPWNLLGSSQFRLIPLIQVASVTGIYGVSFLLVWTSLSLLGAAMVIIRRPAKRSAWMVEIILPMLTVMACYALGSQKVLRAVEKSPQLTVALIQPSIPQSLIWDEKENYHRFEELLKLSEKALAARPKPDLLVWPEAAVPGLIRIHHEIADPIMAMAKSNRVWIIIGGDDFTLHPNAKSLEDADFFNSSFLISPEGKVAAEYKKRNLVIFGEYIPLVRWLPFIKYFTPIDGGFTAGDKVVPFELANLRVKLAVLICFEDVFPHLVTEYVSDDTDFLVNLTNNGWFGEGAAQWQHAAAAIFRAVENGVPLVRCSNNGLTGWVDSCGRLRQVFESDEEGIYGRGFLLTQIPLLNPGELRQPTFYHQHGDLFGWTCAGIIMLRWLKLWLPARRRVPS